MGPALRLGRHERTRDPRPPPGGRVPGHRHAAVVGDPSPPTAGRRRWWPAILASMDATTTPDAERPNPAGQTDDLGVIRPLRTLWLVSGLHAANHAIGFVLPLVYLAVAAEFLIGADEIAFLAAATALSAGLLQLAFSSLTRVAARRVLLGVGGLVMGAGMSLLATTTSFATFAAVTIASRLGGAPQHPVGNALLSEQFPPARRGFAISAHIAGGNVGTLLVPIVGATLIAGAGWRSTVVVFGLIAAVVSIAALAFIRESGADRAAARASGSVRSGFRRLLADPDHRWLYLSSVLGGGGRGLGIVNLFALLHLRDVAGIDEATAALMYGVLLAFSVPGPLVAGWLSDRLGRKPLIVGVYLGGAGSFVLFVAAGSDPLWLWAAIVLMGCFSFAESPQLQALLADTTPGELRDVSYSAFFTIAFVGGSIWTAAYGAVIGALGESAGLPVVFWLMAAAFVLAALATLPIRVVRHERTPLVSVDVG